MQKADLLGKTFGKLTVTSIAESRFGNAHWNCTCECGTECNVSAMHLKSGHTKSCGCLEKERPNNLKDGRTEMPEYRIWAEMIQRCSNPNKKAWKDYGGRGISIDPTWLGETGFATFFRDGGPRPEGKDRKGKALYSIDRFPNNDGNYEPGNVRWATWKQQVDNRRPLRRASEETKLKMRLSKFGKSWSNKKHVAYVETTV